MFVFDTRANITWGTVSTRTLSSKRNLFLLSVLRRDSASAAWYLTPARCLMSSSSPNVIKRHYRSFVVAVVMLRIHQSASWSVRIVERFLCK